MPTFLAELLAQMRGIWSRLDGGQRMTIVSVVLAALVGLGAIVWYAGQPDYETVLHASEPAELEEAIKALGSAGISYKPDGNRLMVERSQAARAMTALYQAGVSGASDPERDNGNVSSVTQDSMTRLDNLMAKQNRRAEKAVEIMQDVVSAYVSASKPKRSVYTMGDDETRPNASVTLVLRRGAAWIPVARAAIQQVAASVGIPVQYVTAINARTKESFSLDGDGHGVGGGEFLSQQRERGLELTRSAQEWLDRLYEGRAIVKVTVDLDPTYTSSEEKIQPENPALLTEDTTKDSSSTGNASPGGDPSTTAAASGQGAGQASNAAGGSQTETKRRTYEPFAGVRRVGMLTPDLRRMTIALVLDESIAAKRTEIENAIKTTVGFLDQRDSGLADEIQTLVEKFPELPAFEEPTAAGFDTVGLLREFGPLTGQIVGVVLVLLFLRKLLRSSATAARIGGGAGGSGGGSSSSTGGVVQEEEEDVSTLNPEDRRRRQRRDIEKSIAEDPAAMTRLIEGWLAEQKA